MQFSVNCGLPRQVGLVICTQHARLMFTMRHTVRASNAAARAILLHCAAPLAKDDIDLYSYQDMANVYLHAYLTKIYVSKDPYTST